MDVKKVGEMVEGYRVLAELGRGAASIIYLVQDPKTKQVWALKHVVKENPKDQRFLEQTETEYEIGSKLDHPNVRHVEKLLRKGGLLSTNEIFLVMEMVDGASVERERPKTFADAAWVFEQVAKALAYIHEMGFVHADMKPNNIVVNDTRDAKVIDLGQSCKVGTVKQRIQGTPDYIAPEQVHRRPITGKTDVYNLGATMYWVFTRQYIPTALPRGDSLVGSLDDNMIERPKPAAELNPRVPDMLSQLIAECVEVEAEKRPESMRVVADRLNLIRAKLVAEAESRKTGGFGKVDAD